MGKYIDMKKDIAKFCKLMRDGVYGSDLVIKHERKNELIRCDTGEVIAIFDKSLNVKK